MRLSVRRGGGKRRFLEEERDVHQRGAWNVGSWWEGANGQDEEGLEEEVNKRGKMSGVKFGEISYIFREDF